MKLSIRHALRSICVAIVFWCGIAPGEVKAQTTNTICCGLNVLTGTTSCTFNGPFDQFGFCSFPNNTNGVQIPTVANVPPNAAATLQDIVSTPYDGVCFLRFGSTAPDFCLVATAQGGLQQTNLAEGFVCTNGGLYGQYETCYGAPPCASGTFLDSTGTSCCTPVQNLSGDGTPCDQTQGVSPLPNIPQCVDPTCTPGECGTTLDNCTGNVLSCGCPAGQSCSGGFCQCNQPLSCAQLHDNCGVVTDSCTGFQQNCGTCARASGESCVSNTCECAANSCSPQCGNICPVGQVCNDNGIGCVSCASENSCGSQCPGHSCPSHMICDSVGRCVAPDQNVPAVPARMSLGFAAALAGLGFVAIRRKRRP